MKIPKQTNPGPASYFVQNAIAWILLLIFLWILLLFAYECGGMR